MSIHEIDEDSLSEIVEYIEESESLLLKLEKEDDLSHLKTLKRNLHSLKGLCGMLGVNAMESFFHRAESFLIKNELNLKDASSLILSYWHNLFEYIESNDDALLLGLSFDLKKVSKDTFIDQVNLKMPNANLTDTKLAGVRFDKSDFSFKGLKAIIVDDDQDLLDLFSELLESKGIIVRVCRDLSSLRSLMVKSGVPDVVFVDNHLESESGLEIIKGLHKIVPSLPSIMISGYLDLQIIMTITNHGSIGALSKPIDEACLDRLLHRVARKVHADEIYIKVFHILSDIQNNSKENMSPELKKQLSEAFALLSSIYGKETFKNNS